MNRENKILIETHLVTAFDDRAFYVPVELFIYHSSIPMSGSVYAHAACYGRDAVFSGDGHAEGHGYDKYRAAACDALRAAGITTPDRYCRGTLTELLEGVARELGFSNLKAHVLTERN